MCVQSLDDSRGFAIRITYRISLRSSSLWEPRHPLLKLVIGISLHNGNGSNQAHIEPTIHVLNVTILHFRVIKSTRVTS